MSKGAKMSKLVKLGKIKKYSGKVSEFEIIAKKSDKKLKSGQDLKTGF